MRMQVATEEYRQARLPCEVEAESDCRRGLDAARRSGAITAYKIYGVSRDGAKVVHTIEPTLLRQAPMSARPAA